MSQEYAKSYDQLLDGAEVRHTSFYQQRPPPIVWLLSQTIVLVLALTLRQRHRMTLRLSVLSLITLYITQAPVTRLRDTETLLSDPETQQMGDTSTRSASGSGSGPGPSEVNIEIKEWKRCKCILISARGLDV